MDVGGWLRGLGLEQYEANFRDNKVDAAILPQLTADDLKDIGVAAVGDRRRLLAAIGALAGATPPSSSATSAPTPAAPKSAQVSAERRPITVMFCDLVGSTSMAAKLDAEDWRNLVNSYLDAASGAVTGLGGHVLKKLGDGLMALFGYPQAQENDAERAVRAALAIQRALQEINARNAGKGAPQLLARIGLESGPVVVDGTGEVFGDAPNVAARVQAFAEPGAVLITINVQRQVAGLFVAEERGPQELKGVAEPVPLFRVVRASGAGRRSGGRALTPFVGREDEIGLLARRWERARAGEGQLVLIVGEPGLGKSRLIEEHRARIAETPHTWVEWSASQLLQNTPLHPIAEWGRLRFGAADVPAEQRLADLESSLRQVKIDADEAAPLLAPLLDIPLPPGRVAQLSPEEMRRKQLASIVSWILAGARAQPVVLAFEDLQWADPSSIDVLRALAERGAQAPLFLVATARPEFRPPWDLRSHHGVISLSPLEQAQVVRMVGEIASRHALSKDVIDGVSKRTGGVPLFIEEVTRLLLERGEQGGAQAIPLTLQQSLAARLDRLGSARETAQIGAVLGREFSYALLSSVAAVDRASEGTLVSRRAIDRGAAPVAGVADPGSQRHAALSERGYSDPALQSALERLVDSDILFVEGAPPSATYRFKHALIQDAAYDSLLRSRRQALHRRAAEALRDTASPEPEAIAHHFTQGGLDDAAIEWWGKAGDQALRRSAFQEAIAHLGKAIAMADNADDVAGLARETKLETRKRLKLQTDYSQALMWSKGYAAGETKVAVERAQGLLGAGDSNPVEHWISLYSQWVGKTVRGETKAARSLAEGMRRDADDSSLTMEAKAAGRILGLSCALMGDFREAHDLLTNVLQDYDPACNRESRFRFTMDTRIGAMIYLAIPIWHFGDATEAQRLVEEATSDALAAGHAGTLANACGVAAIFDVIRGDARAARTAALTASEVGQEHGMRFYIALADLVISWAHGELEDRDSGASKLRAALTSWFEQGNKLFAPPLQARLAEFDSRGPLASDALAEIDEAIALAAQTDARWTDSLLHRIRGDVLLRRDPGNLLSAEEAFNTAAAIARQQGSRSFGLQAALPLAKLYQSTGRLAEAHAVLAPALEGFSPTAEMPEIAEAQALLTALAATDEAKTLIAQQQRRLDLHTAYGHALSWGKGFAAKETMAAFARVGAFAGAAENINARFVAHDAQWRSSLMRGELSLARRQAEAFLRDAELEGRATEAGVALRNLGLVFLCQANFEAANSVLERALANYIPERERETESRFGRDTEVNAASYLALMEWHLGQVERARDLTDRALRRAEELGSIPAKALALFWKTNLEVRRHDVSAAGQAADTFLAMTEEHGIRTYTDFGRIYASWARGRQQDPATGAARLRETLDAFVAQGNKVSVPYFKGLLAELEATATGPDCALTLIDDGLTIARETGEHFTDPYLHLLRGDLLLRRDPANLDPAQEAYRTAITIAQQQGARSYELLAALALAKLYQSTGRPADAYAVLAPALERFPALSLLPSGRRAGDEGTLASNETAGALTPDPSPVRERGEAAYAEMPELREVEALLAALEDTTEVKAESGRRKRRHELQVAYGNALIAARGFGAAETAEAFARARDAADGRKNASERFAADFGLWAGSYARGELTPMRTHAAALLAAIAASPDSPEAGVAHRVQGTTSWFAGKFLDARVHLERALALFQPGRDDELAYRFAVDLGVSAMEYLAFACWTVGEVERAASLIDRMRARISGLTHAHTLAAGAIHAALFELMRGDHPRARTDVLDLVRVLDKHDLRQFRVYGLFLEGWATAKGGAIADGLQRMRRAVENLGEQGVLVFDGLNKSALADVEAEAGDPDRALAVLEDALATAERSGYRAFEAELRRAQGDILLKRDPANRAPAEEAFQTAIAVALQQGARSYQLRAAFSLAKLYQSTGRRVEAHAVLAPALGGFSPTPEMPEIAEAQTLLEQMGAAGTAE